MASTPDWNDFRFALALHRAATLAGAASLLHVDATTVGRRIATLEKALGARLFDRTQDGFRASATGLAMLPSLESVEDAFLALERRVAGKDERVEGRVRLTCPDAFGPFFTTRLGQLRRTMPGIELEVSGAAARLNLSRREADIALRMARPEQPNLIARRAMEMAFAVYASSSYLARRGRPLPGRGFDGHDVIGYTDDLAPTPPARWLAGVLRDTPPSLRASSFVAVADAAEAGLGLAVLPCFVADERAGLRRVPPGIVAHSTGWIVVHEDMQRSARVRAVLDALETILREEAPLLSGERARTPETRGRRHKR